jgi:hypothetical protein
VKRGNYDKNFSGGKSGIKGLPQRWMNRRRVIASAHGIGYAKVHSMKNLELVFPSEPGGLKSVPLPAAKRPQKIVIVFEEPVGALRIRIQYKTIFEPATISLQTSTATTNASVRQSKPHHES